MSPVLEAVPRYRLCQVTIGSFSALSYPGWKVWCRRGDSNPHELKPTRP